MSLRRAVLFAVILLVVLAFVTLTDGDYAHIARHFLSNLFRHLF